jgi:hypothetical protein
MKSQPEGYQYQLGEGEYRLSVSSGALSGVAAGTATAGHIFTARWAPADGKKPRLCVIRRIGVTLRTITGFTAAQEVGFDAFVARANTASSAGGTAIDLTTNTNTNKKRTTYATSQLIARIAAAAELTAGTQTLDANPFLQASYADLAAAATVPKGLIGGVYPPDMEVGSLVLAVNEGIVIRNLIALGAGGTARLTVDLDWSEVERY